jgi:hypothetical protein
MLSPGVSKCARHSRTPEIIKRQIACPRNELAALVDALKHGDRSYGFEAFKVVCAGNTRTSAGIERAIEIIERMCTKLNESLLSFTTLGGEAATHQLRGVFVVNEAHETPVEILELY